MFKHLREKFEQPALVCDLNDSGRAVGREGPKKVQRMLYRRKQQLALQSSLVFDFLDEQNSQRTHARKLKLHFDLGFTLLDSKDIAQQVKPV